MVSVSWRHRCAFLFCYSPAFQYLVYAAKSLQMGRGATSALHGPPTRTRFGKARWGSRGSLGTWRSACHPTCLLRPYQKIKIIDLMLSHLRRQHKFLCLEDATIAEGQGASEDRKFVAKPTQSNMTLFFANGINSSFCRFLNFLRYIQENHNYKYLYYFSGKWQPIKLIEINLKILYLKQ